MTASNEFKLKQIIIIKSGTFEYLIIGKKKMATMYQYAVVKNPKKYGKLIYFYNRFLYLIKPKNWI